MKAFHIQIIVKSILNKLSRFSGSMEVFMFLAFNAIIKNTVRAIQACILVSNSLESATFSVEISIEFYDHSTAHFHPLYSWDFISAL